MAGINCPVHLRRMQVLVLYRDLKPHPCYPNVRRKERCMHMIESHRVVRIGVVIPIRFCIVHELVHQRIYTYRGYTKKTVFFQ